MNRRRHAPAAAPAATPEPTQTGVAAAAPVPALAGWALMLELGMTMTALTLRLLQAQHAALAGMAPPAAVALAPAGARLTIGEIFGHVAAAGFHEISEIEWEDDHYEVEARNAAGQAVELRVDGHSGAIEEVPLDDD